MGRIKIAQAKPGQIVSKDISDSRGTVLLRADSELTADTIGRLVHRGIASLEIKDEQQSATALTPQECQAKLRELEQVLQCQFEGTLDNPLMGALFEATKRHHAGKVH